MPNYNSVEDALLVAKDILTGKVDPNLGCGLIAEVSRQLGSPHFLQQFSLLAHEQGGHAALGISARACVPEIMAACRELIAIKHP